MVTKKSDVIVIFPREPRQKELGVGVTFLFVNNLEVLKMRRQTSHEDPNHPLCCYRFEIEPVL